MSPLILCVGVDFTEASRVAMKQALRLLEGRGGELHVVTVVPELTGAAGNLAVLSRTMDADLVRLRSFVDDTIPSDDRVHVCLHVRIGKPAAVIHQLARDYDADTIVVGTHGRTGIGKMLLGSVAQELTQIAHCPVFVSKERDWGSMPKTPRLDSMPAESPELHRSQVRGSVRPVDRSSHVSGLL